MKRPARKPMTLDEIDALEDATGQRYELWHGEPVAMTGGTLRHNLIALGLSRAIYPRLQPGCRVVVADVKLRLGERMDSNATYPGHGGVRSPARELSNATRIARRGTLRRQHPARPGGQTWRLHRARVAGSLPDPLAAEEVLVDVYTRAEGWRRERCEGQEGEIRIAALGLSLPLREVYADVLADLGD